MKPIRLLCSLLALALLAACVSVDTTPPPPTPSQIALDSGDQLQITVLGQTDLSGAFTIDAAGNVTLPLVGTVGARGRTTQGLAGVIENALRQSYLRDPDVTVQVTQYRPFFVLGEVGNPGQYPFVAGLTVQQAVAIAGGFTPRANQTGFDVVRRSGTASVQMHLRLNDPILPGDTLTVRQRLF
jgi:polysaccharide export outer membrane protein